MVVVSLEREPILAFCCVSPQQRARFTDTSSLFFFFFKYSWSINADHTQFLEKINVLSVSDYVEVWAVFRDLNAYNACLI